MFSAKSKLRVIKWVVAVHDAIISFVQLFASVGLLSLRKADRKPVMPKVLRPVLPGGQAS